MSLTGEALIVVDVQNDFCPGGTLAVTGGDEIIDGINAWMDGYETVVLTQDWHPEDHASFAINQPGHEPFSMIEMPYGPQVLWPVHCVQGSHGAEFHPRLRTDPAHLIVRKGFRSAIDSYSAFFENDHRTLTGLDGYLKSLGITRLVFVGLATDYCVAYSAIDAAKLGYEVAVEIGLTRAIDLDGSLAAARARMTSSGVRVIG